VAQRLEQQSTRRFLDLQRQRIRDCYRVLDDAGYGSLPLADYPGKQVPTIISRWFGPIAMTTTRRGSAADNDPQFEISANLVQPSQYTLPKFPLQVPSDRSFEWHGVHAAALLSWTWKTGSTLNVNSPPVTPLLIHPQENKSYLDSVLDANGGGQWFLNFSGFAMTDRCLNMTNVQSDGVGYCKFCWELELYDRRRGRSLTEGPIPAEAFSPGAWGTKPVDDRPIFDADTEVEPRLFVRELRMTSLLDNSIAPQAPSPFATIFDEANVSVFLNVALTGRLIREVTE
jgi:hypothetical protein